MSIFGERIQTSTFGWLKLFVRISFKALFSMPGHEVYVLELSPETPTGMRGHSYLRPDVSIVTAVTPEHMEHYDNLGAVAAEELAVSSFSRYVLVNIDMVAQHYIEEYGDPDKVLTYGIDNPATYTAVIDDNKIDGIDVSLNLSGRTLPLGNLPLIGTHSAYMVLAAGVAAGIFGFTPEEIEKACRKIRAVPGRMQLLEGKNGTVIIDDTYNASPEAVKAALNTLCTFKAAKRVALLGNMNELGRDSEKLHREIGKYVDKDKIDVVVTLGPDANKYLASTLEDRDITVLQTSSPVEAGKMMQEYLRKGTVVLAKGSQNKVYAEEAVKLLLADPRDADKLVRQTDYWPVKKRRQFPEIEDF
jgi:UDP-N-acetylmuramoyl-tripeptide--D-alanyl-D-alanine ligase